MSNLQFDPNNSFKVLLQPRGKRGPAAKYPWRTMAVLDSFTVTSDEAAASSVRSMASAKGRDLGMKFSVTLGHKCVYVTRER